MAGSVNKVILVGNLGRDPEVRNTQGGDKIVNLSVATSETWKDRGTGERKERTEWHRVVIFNPNLADVAEKYLRKGAKVYVEGQLQTRKWQDKDGHDKYSTEVVLGRFKGELTMLEGRDGGGASAGGGAGGNDGYDDGYFGGGAPSSGGKSAPAGGGKQGGGGWDAGAELDDEIPF